VPTPSTRNSKCGICEREGRDFRHGYMTCAYHLESERMKERQA
jgi:hypothetical protein